MSDIISLVNSLVELSTGINNAQLTKKVSELTLALAQIEIEKAQLIRENFELKEGNRILREDRENPLIFSKENNLYYHPDDKEHVSPFCQHCYETSRLRIHLTKKKFECPHCNTDYFYLFAPPIPFA
jgi:hypothetical protein